MEKEGTILQLEEEIKDLKRQLAEKEVKLFSLKFNKATSPYSDGLSTQEVVRYSRQIIIPNVGVEGQAALKNGHVLIVGAGGLGCPAALYLAAAGVGNITIVDSDEVELSNLHRQILHSESTLGIPKVQSAYESLKRINSDISIKPLHIQLDSKNVLSLLGEFDVVIDGTDNVATRYLLNDACVLQNKPLVSGSALQMEGQLTVYHYKNGPCYRCLFPVPPPPETITSCGDGGVLGSVPGCIGVLQALEAIKILLGLSGVLSGRLLLFDGAETIFRTVRLRERSPLCEVCGNIPTIKEPIDYEQFCQAKADDKVRSIDILNTVERITVNDFDRILKYKNCLILDVRPSIEFQMCRLPNCLNIPYTNIEKGNLIKVREAVKDINPNTPVYVLCRRGNDSQRAVKILRKDLHDLPVTFIDVIGGLHAYSAKIDPTFPVY